MIRSIAKLARAITGALLIAALTSCGLKGDLYLPEPEPAAATNQDRNADETDAANGITTVPNEPAVATDEDRVKAVRKPSESASPQP